MSGIGSIWHWIVVALIVLILFGRGRISETMGDFGKGIRSFRKGLGEEDDRSRPAPPRISPKPPAAGPAPAPTPTADASRDE